MDEAFQAEVIHQEYGLDQRINKVGPAERLLGICGSDGHIEIGFLDMQLSQGISSTACANEGEMMTSVFLEIFYRQICEVDQVQEDLGQYIFVVWVQFRETDREPADIATDVGGGFETLKA